MWIAFAVDFILVATSWTKAWLPDIILGPLLLLTCCYLLFWMVAVGLGMVAHSSQFSRRAIVLGILGLFVCGIFFFLSLAAIRAVYHL